MLNVYKIIEEMKGIVMENMDNKYDTIVKLPDKYIDKAIYRFKMEKNNFLKNINIIINKYEQKFKLKKIELIENLTINIVLKAYCEKFGYVILKIGVPDSIKYEIDFIKKCNSKYIVRCYYYNYEDGIMILEKIKPGYSLNILDNIDDRLRIVSDIANDILINCDYNEVSSKRYSKSFYDKVNDEKIYNNLDIKMKEIVEIAKTYYHEIEQMNLKEYILHRDLHYKNILKSQDLWCVIDPHGIIGYKVFEIPQIVKSELEMVNHDINKLESIIFKLSTYFKEDTNLIYKSLYVDTVEKILFLLSNGYKKEDIDYQKNICNAIIKYIKN